MYDERTTEWRGVLEDLEKRKDGLGLVIPPKDKSRILAASAAHIRAMSRIVETVAGLDKLLKEQRSAYLAAHGGMLERERDEVDVGADSISRQCRLLIGKYRDDVEGLRVSEEGKQHYCAVADGLDSYLKGVVSVHSEMRAVRVARQIRQKKLSRLEINSVESRAQEIGAGQGKQGGISVAELQDAAKAAAAARGRQTYSGYSSEEEGEELSVEEQQAMEMENERLVEQLSSLTSQVEQVQSKVVKVAELQAVFTEKVLEQADILDVVHAQAVNTTENTKEGNEEVRKAIQNMASYRVYILFILLVFSFSLLFLDWYND